jgi:hypothetical protein
VPIDLLIVLVVVTLLFAVGVPAIRLGVWLPRRLEFERLRDDELSSAQREHFQKLDLGLAKAAYTPRMNFAVVNMQGPTLTRVYLSDHEPAVLGAHCLRSASVIDDKVVSGHNYLEWITKYEDGATLTTRNAELADVFDRMPHQLRQECVGVTDPLVLKARHDAKAVGLLHRHPRHPQRADILGEFADFHDRWCRFQESRGLLVPAANGARYNVSVRAALRGVVNYLNPLADNFTPLRFLAGLVLGAGIPIVATWLLTPDAPWRPAGLPVVAIAGALLRMAALGAAYAVAGIAVGCLFTGKAFIWAALLGYLGLRLGGASGVELWLAVWMGFVAEQAGRYRTKRQILV